MGEPRIVPNFLPPPDQLVFREEGVKVTITLSERSIEFFKHHASKHGTQYQRMIRNLLNAYVDLQPATRAKSKPGKKRASR